MRIDALAVGYGAVAGLVVASISMAVGFFAPYQQYPEWTPVVLVVNRMLGIVSYAVAGAVAGATAGERGLLHGALAGLGAGVMSRIVAFALTGALYGRLAVEAQWTAWLPSLGWLVVGVAIAAVAGALTIAVRSNRARSP